MSDETRAHDPIVPGWGHVASSSAHAHSALEVTTRAANEQTTKPSSRAAC
jgi:hypothetical protein